MPKKNTAPVLQTPVLQTTVPQTTVPQTTVPQTTVPQTTVPQTPVPQTVVTPAINKEPCPRCGQGKFKTVTFAKMNGGEKVTQPILLCPTCTDAFKAYQQRVIVANIALIRNDPSAPEPAGPMDKFCWVLEETTPDRFQVRAQTAQDTYRRRYDEAVVALLRQRGYLEGNTHWEGKLTIRPVMKFTRDALNGNGPNLLRNIENDLTTGLPGLQWSMGNAARCLEEAHAARVAQLRKELESKLAKSAASKADQGK